MNIVILFRTRNILDDFREAYFWLRQNTDEHARVMSWWDYGYQIAGMANRTTLVDNNTWNNSHIALVRTWLTEGQKLQTVIHYLDIRLHLWLSRKTGGESAFCFPRNLLFKIRITRCQQADNLPSQLQKCKIQNQRCRHTSKEHLCCIHLHDQPVSQTSRYFMCVLQ